MFNMYSTAKRQLNNCTRGPRVSRGWSMRVARVRQERDCEYVTYMNPTRMRGVCVSRMCRTHVIVKLPLSSTVCTNSLHTYVHVHVQ